MGLCICANFFVHLFSSNINFFVTLRMKKNYFLFLLLLLLLSFRCGKRENRISFSDFGALPNVSKDAASAAVKLMKRLQVRTDTGRVTVTFPKGRYDFYPDSAFTREYYISNHDQDQPKRVGFALEGLKKVTIDGQGSTFVFHGRMIPFALIRCDSIILKNFSIDFELPALRQLEVTDVDTATRTLTAAIYPTDHHRIEGNRLIAVGEGYENPLNNGMPFRKDRRLAYNRQDLLFNPGTIEEPSPNILLLKNWYQIPLTAVGERFALRSYHRPTPGIFISESSHTIVEHIDVHYAEGMGLLAQMSENITLDGFRVCLKGEGDPRYFTTQADATHFSACKGTILSRNGLYEGMADDAINVHGTYLRVVARPNDHTLRARYMHPQAWGFKWGEPGDTVQFVESEKMEPVGERFTTTIQEIKAVDQPDEQGAKEFEITFADALPQEIVETGKFGVENLTWTPEVVFKDNIIRNNRARGALFSTPRKVVCSGNLFDHTHGTAILLCGDCNGWYETGACRDVRITDNRFINALTANYQFTNAIISIYPEIPDLEGQQQFFHSGIVIQNNRFETFDRPILYAKSTDGILFRGNTVTTNREFEPFHWNRYRFLFERVNHVLIQNNCFEDGFDPSSDLLTCLSSDSAVTVGN